MFAKVCHPEHTVCHPVPIIIGIDSGTKEAETSSA